MRYKIAKRMLIFWCLFIGIGAIAGSTMMFIDPSGKIIGMDKLLPYFQVLPFAKVLFQNYIFSGISLLIVNGISNIVATVLIIKNKRIGVILGETFGITLMLWICIQFIIFPMNFMDIIYFIFGLLQFITGYVAHVFFRQENFKFNLNEYNNIGKNHKILVVYFSRMGYTRKVAYETANQQGADIYEIKAKERTEGTLGFWWCGRFNMHRWNMPIEEVNVKVEEYEKVIICTPIWVFTLSAPIREFLNQMSGKIKKVEYILIHFNIFTYKNVAKEMDKILKIKNVGLRSVCSKKGKIIYNKEIKENY